MCNQFTFHHQFGIDTWRSKFEQQTDSILSACGSMDKNHKDPDTIDLNAPRHARYMQKAYKKDQNTVYWVDINLALKKRLKFYQTLSNADILHETLPAYCSTTRGTSCSTIQKFPIKPTKSKPRS